MHGWNRWGLWWDLNEILKQEKLLIMTVILKQNQLEDLYLILTQSKRKYQYQNNGY
jgi:hypothetical protein